MKTLLEIQNEVAAVHNFDDWNHLMLCVIMYDDYKDKLQQLFSDVANIWAHQYCEYQKEECAACALPEHAYGKIIGIDKESILNCMNVAPEQFSLSLNHNNYGKDM